VGNVFSVTRPLRDQTDPNKLPHVKASLDGYPVYAPAQVEQMVRLFLGGADRDKLDPILGLTYDQTAA